MEEKEILRIKGERKEIFLLEYYIIVVSDRRIVIGKIWRGRLDLFASTAKWGRYNKMTPEEILAADKNNFEAAFENVKLKESLFYGVMIVKNKEGKEITIQVGKQDFNKLREVIQK